MRLSVRTAADPVLFLTTEKIHESRMRIRKVDNGHVPRDDVGSHIKKVRFKVERHFVENLK